MTRRGWTRPIVVAILAAAGAGAAQLGLGYGLGIIAWAPHRDAEAFGPGLGAWAASLAWTTWLTATSVVIGAVSAGRVRAGVEGGRFLRSTWRSVIALAAAIGGLVIVPLVGVPASAAEPGDTFAPHLLAGVYAVAGVVLGLLLALLALAARAIAANVIASAVWLWALAIVAVIDSVLAGRGLGFAQLAVWRFTDGGPVWRDFYVPGALLMLGAAVLLGGLAAFPAAGRGEGRIGVALSGAAGPLIVALAYVLAAPSFDQAPIEQTSAYLTAPYTIVAGLAGSLLVAVIGSVPTRPAPPAAIPPTAIPPAAIPPAAIPPTAVSRSAVAPAAAPEAGAPAAPPPGPVSTGREPALPGGTMTVTGKASVPGSLRAMPPR